MKYLPDTFGKVLYKHTFSSDNNESDQFKLLDLTKKTRRSSELLHINNINVLKPLHSKPLPLSKEKLKDLQSLLPYINEASRPFYNNLIQSVGHNSRSCSEEDTE